MQFRKPPQDHKAHSAKSIEVFTENERQEQSDWSSLLGSLVLYAVTLAIFFALVIFLSRVNWMPFDFPQAT